MKAITVKQPWAWAIAHADKDIENRSTNLKCVEPGGIIAIHAGKGWASEAGQQIANITDEEFACTDEKKATGIIALARFGGNVTEHNSPYFTGPVGWVLHRRTPLAKPLPINGKQGPWELSNSLLLRHLGFQLNQTKMDQWQLSRKFDKKTIAELNLSGTKWQPKVICAWQPKVICADSEIGSYSHTYCDYRTARKWAEEEACLQWCDQS
jgi:hypothetical protein